MNAYMLYHDVDLGYHVLYVSLNSFMADSIKIAHNQKYDALALTWAEDARALDALNPWCDPEFKSRFGSLSKAELEALPQELFQEYDDARAAYSTKYAVYMLGRVDGIVEMEVL